MPTHPRQSQHLREPTEQTRTTVVAGFWMGAGAVVLLCLIFAFLVIQHARSTSATYDETTHLPSGYTYLRWGDYRMNPEHPPLVKHLAGLPLLGQHPWPSEIEPTREELGPGPATDSLLQIKRFWATGRDQIDAQWYFGHHFLYGVRDETVQRLGAQDPIAVPTTAQLEQKDFYNDADRLLFRGRMMIMGLGVLLGILTFAWARELYGMAGGVFALALFCLDPNFIAHSGLVTTDVGVTLFMFGAVYFLWRTCRRMDALSIALMLLCVALAFATKFSAVLLVPMFLLAGVGRVLSPDPWPAGMRGQHRIQGRLPKAVALAGLMAAAAVASYAVIWAAYGFRYFAAKDAAHTASATDPVAPPAGKSDDGIPQPAVAQPPQGRFPIEDVVRRTAATKVLLRHWPREKAAPEMTPLVQEKMDNAPVGVTGQFLLFAQRNKLLPEAYLFGFAHAQMKSLMRGSYLRGEHSSRGFWDYFLWTFALKTPLVTLAAIAAAVVFTVRRRDPWGMRLAFLIVPIVVYWAVSMRSSLNIGHRHLLPIYPFLFVLCAGLAMEWRRLPSRTRTWVASLSLAAVVLGNFVVFAPPWKPALVYPHYLAYFNELAGGPRNGHKSLVDSNLDWGQDLKNLKHWLDKNQIKDPVHLCYFGMADPRYHGIQHIAVPKILGGYMFAPSPYDALEAQGRFAEAVDRFARDLRPGHYIAISATNRSGVYTGKEVRDFWQRILNQSTYIDHIGYSIFIYRLGPPTP